MNDTASLAPYYNDLALAERVDAPDLFAPPLALTPYTAFHVQPQMEDDIRQQVQPAYQQGKAYTGLIADCRYGDAPEPPVGWVNHCEPHFNALPIRITGVADNGCDLQILMVSVSGRTERKDRIPYHMIWSAAVERGGLNIVADTSYCWPVTELSFERTQERRKGSLHPVWVSTPQFRTTERSYTRHLPRLEKAAEALAILAGRGEAVNYRPVNIPLIIRADDTCYLRRPALYLVENDEGRRKTSLLICSQNTSPQEPMMG